MLTSAEREEAAAVRWLNHFGFDWPNVIDALESDRATDLQSLAPDDAK